MLDRFPWLGNLYELPNVSLPIMGFVCVAASVLCGAVVGLDRERREKPAGLRTLILICVGSTIFTMTSIFMANKPISDPARIAAQIIPGIGFLGAGAIIRGRGSVIGLTTGATIWAVAAVGMMIGGGLVVAGVALTLVIYLTLTVVDKLDWIAIGSCGYQRLVIRYEAGGGKTRIYLQDLLDSFRIPDHFVEDLDDSAAGLKQVSVRICVKHREHRAILRPLADVPGVKEVETQGAPISAGA